MTLHEKLLQREHVCPWWLAYTFDNPLRRIFHRPEKTLGPYLEAGMTAVDIGCGMGYFSIGMAGIVGEKGRVIAVDLQQKMLDITARRAAKRGVMDRIQLHRCDPDALGLTCEADFALTFWMVHEVPDRLRFLEQVRSVLKPGGKYLLAEPRFHVSAAKFEKTLQEAVSAGFWVLDSPGVALSRAVLFKNPIQ